MNIKSIIRQWLKIWDKKSTFIQFQYEDKFFILFAHLLSNRDFDLNENDLKYFNDDYIYFLN
jgi:hypothetical protein